MAFGTFSFGLSAPRHSLLCARYRIDHRKRTLSSTFFVWPLWLPRVLDAPI